MDSQKIENELNLALDSTISEREESLNLGVGYDVSTNSWELIVRYIGSLARVRALGIEVVELLNNYAILTVPQELIEEISRFDEIIYIEKPKRLNFEVVNGKRVSCINSVQETSFILQSNAVGGDINEQSLFGFGVIVAIIDSGIDYLNNAFIDENGNTRILELWDQTVESEENPPPEGYNVGALYTEEDINIALKSDDPTGIVPSRDRSGHGTEVASIAVGNFATSKSSNVNNDIGIATRARIIVVKLGNPRDEGFPRTSELMQAIDFCVRRGVFYNSPIAINLSFGNNYGSHDGRSLLATYIDSTSNVGRNVIVVGTGNEGAESKHTGGVFSENGQNLIEFAVGNYEPSLNIQLWKSYSDSVRVEVISPSGIRSGEFDENLGAYTYLLGRTKLLVYYGKPSPYSVYQEIYMELLPADEETILGNGYVETGIWNIRLSAGKISDGKYDLWMPTDLVSSATGFIYPTPYTTLTIPSTSDLAISVGAYDAYNFSYADFSGRGYTRATNQVKPDIVAPGVNIRCSSIGGRIVTRSGTSFATPFVTGAAALLMQWGITNGNDRFLYGEKVKAYLIRGASRLNGYDVPSPEVGWGALCLRDSIPYS